MAFFNYVRSFFVKETVPYLRTQRSFSQLRFLKIKNFVESCMCSWCDVLLRCSFGDWIQYMFPEFYISRSGWAGFPPFWCEVTNQQQGGFSCDVTLQ